jgi:hypothetical protein
MFGGIIQRFSHREIQIVPHLRRQRHWGRGLVHVQSAAHVGGAEKLLGDVPEIRIETGQGIIGRIDCPDDFVE